MALQETTYSTQLDEREPDAYTVNASCWKLSVSRSTLYQLIAAGTLRSVKIRGRRMIPTTELKRLVAEGA
jgi:excisionase family DNA binding protein